VKFCYVVWQPSGVPVMLRGLLSTHKGAVTSAFRPFHCDFFATERSDLDHEKAMHHLSGLTGTRSKVRDKAATLSAGDYSSSERGKIKVERKALHLPILPAGKKQELDIIDADALQQAIAAVRGDSHPTNWVLAGWKKTSPGNSSSSSSSSRSSSGGGLSLALTGSGAGGLDELVAALPESGFSHGLVRVTETIDASETVKFCYLSWQPEAVPLQTKGKLGTLLGEVSSIFQPSHGSFCFSEKSELVLATVMGRVSVARTGVARTPRPGAQDEREPDAHDGRQPGTRLRPGSI